MFSVFLKLFQKISEEGIYPNLFYIAPTTLTTNLKIPPKKKGKDQYHWHENPQQNTSKLNVIIHCKDHIWWSRVIYPRGARIFRSASQSVRYTISTNCENRNHMIVSIDGEKAFDKIWHPLRSGSWLWLRSWTPYAQIQT